MVRQPVRLALLLGAITALAVSPAQANHCSAPCRSSCGPTTRTIRTTECVPETYTAKRTVYKVECRKEVVDGFRCEKVNVQKERTVTCIERVPVYKEEVRKVCHKTTVYEEREVCKKVWKTVEETVMKKKLVALGHWECREARSLSGILGGHGCKSSCNDSCSTSCDKGCARTRKVWVHCPQYQCCPTKVCKKVCVEEKVKCKVPVCKTEWREEKVKVCTYQCVEKKKTEKYTECVIQKVPCKIERTVRVCVPHEETVTCTRMVRKCVERQVACPAPASNACNDCCRPSLGDRVHSALGRLRCNAGCDRGCRSNGCH